MLTLGRVRLCRERRRVWVGAREVALTPMEFDLLVYLLERPDRAVSRHELLADVWGFISPGLTRTVEVHVAGLRKKLGDRSLIRTVRGVGYAAVSPPPPS